MRGQHNLVLIGVLFAMVSQTDLSWAGQDAPPSTRAASTATSYSQAPQSAGSASPPLTGLAQQEALTGEWGGVRTRWKDKGVVLDSSLTQFYQGVALRTSFVSWCRTREADQAMRASKMSPSST
jgi:hypothetical protein